MNKDLLLPLCVFLFSVTAYAQSAPAAEGLSSGVTINKSYSLGQELQAIMDRYTSKDLPGVALAIYSESEGWWSAASGYAKTESKTPMTVDHLQYLQSVTKTYAAVAALRLSEEGKLDLDAPISKYLPKKYNRLIRNIDQITVRMLMNHTSGIAEYNSHPKYTADVILHPLKVLDMEEVINCLENEEQQFAPGTKYQYTNTNYFLLTVIEDVVSGNHAKYFEEKIFRPLQLNNSFYRSSKGYLTYPLLPDSYWDILGTGRPANITPMQVANVAALRGDDGIVATPIDAVKFLKGLMEGKLINSSSMDQMKQWVKNEEGREVYGLGLSRMEAGSIVAFGHGGGGLGAGCLLLYVPAKKVYLFLATNIGLVIEGPVGVKVDAMRNEIMGVVLR